MAKDIVVKATINSSEAEAGARRFEAAIHLMERATKSLTASMAPALAMMTAIAASAEKAAKYSRMGGAAREASTASTVAASAITSRVVGNLSSNSELNALRTKSAEGYKASTAAINNLSAAVKTGLIDPAAKVKEASEGAAKASVAAQEAHRKAVGEIVTAENSLAALRAKAAAELRAGRAGAGAKEAERVSAANAAIAAAEKGLADARAIGAQGIMAAEQRLTKARAAIDNAQSEKGKVSKSLTKEFTTAENALVKAQGSAAKLALDAEKGLAAARSTMAELEKGRLSRALQDAIAASPSRALVNSANADLARTLRANNPALETSSKAATAAADKLAAAVARQAAETRKATDAAARDIAKSVKAAEDASTKKAAADARAAAAAKRSADATLEKANKEIIAAAQKSAKETKAAAERARIEQNAADRDLKRAQKKADDEARIRERADAKERRDLIKSQEAAEKAAAAKLRTEAAAQKAQQALADKTARAATVANRVADNTKSFTPAAGGSRMGASEYQRLTGTRIPVEFDTLRLAQGLRNVDAGLMGIRSSAPGALAMLRDLFGLGPRADAVSKLKQMTAEADKLGKLANRGFMEGTTRALQLGINPNELSNVAARLAAIETRANAARRAISSATSAEIGGVSAMAARASQLAMGVTQVVTATGVRTLRDLRMAVTGTAVPLSSIKERAETAAYAMLLMKSGVATATAGIKQMILYGGGLGRLMSGTLQAGLGAAIGSFNAARVASTAFAGGIGIAKQSISSFASIVRTPLQVFGAGGTFGVIMAAKALVEYGDAHRTLMNRLRSSSGDDAPKVYERVLATAQRLRTEMPDLAAMFQRIKASTAGAFDDARAMALAESITSIAIATGRTEGELGSLKVQLPQVLSAGKLSGDEFRTFMEAMPPLIDEMVKRLGISRGELIRMAHDQKIAATEVVASALALGPKFSQMVRDMPRTFGQAMIQMRNDLQNVLGTMMDSGGHLDKFVASVDKIRELIVSPEFGQGMSMFATGIADATLKIVTWIANKDAFLTVATAIESAFTTLGKAALAASEAFAKSWSNVTGTFNAMAAFSKEMANVGANFETALKANEAAARAAGGVSYMNLGQNLPMVNMDGTKPLTEEEKKRLNGTGGKGPGSGQRQGENLAERLKTLNEEIKLNEAKLTGNQALIDKQEQSLAVERAIGTSIKDQNSSIARQIENAALRIEQQKQLLKSFDEMKSLGTDIGNNLADVFMQVGEGTTSFRDGLRQSTAEIVRMTLKAMILKPIIEAMSSSFASGSAGTASTVTGSIGKFITGLFGGGDVGLGSWAPTQFAKGGVFGGSGSVINGPTMFMGNGKLSVAGEAGEEGVLPLARGANGKLGVHASGLGGGSSGGIVINIPVTVEGDMTDATLAKVERIASAVVSKNIPGIIDRTTVSIKKGNRDNSRYFSR